MVFVLDLGDQQSKVAHCCCCGTDQRIALPLGDAAALHHCQRLRAESGHLGRGVDHLMGQARALLPLGDGNGRQATAKQSAPDTSTAKAVPNAKAAVDFGGKPADTYQWNMAQNIKPKASGFALISSAYASDMPMSSCEADKPRSAGQVLSMADDKPLPRYATKEYMPGYNNRVWANTVNGHLVTVSPVSILRDNAQVDRQPILQVVQGYKSSSQKKAQSLKAVANTYEGESEVLYRVFTSDPKAPVSCMDLVFSKGNAKVSQGALFYPAGSEAYVASYKPIPATHSK